MQQLTMARDRAVEWWDVPAPALEDDRQALVRPIAVALCDMDQPTLRGETPVAGPVALGHEFVAEVLDVGDAVRTVTPGQRVVVPFQISCGECARCRAGLTGSCATVPPLSMYGFGAFGGDWGGALSDVVRVPFADAMLVPLPAGVAPATAASTSDNVPDAWRTVAAPLAARPEAEVLIVGGGTHSIALYAVDAARALGAARVLYVDGDADRRGVAAGLGAETAATVPREARAAFPITVDASIAHDGLHAALRATAPGGVCTSVSIYFEPLTPVPLLEMYTTGVTLVTGRATARHHLPEVLEHIAAGHLHLEAVTTATVPWAQAREAVTDWQTKLVVER
jgi:alcohol dehydrogenase